jgi:hypothetical protein
MNTLLIIISILVVLFFMQQRECFAIDCTNCAKRLERSNCMAIPMRLKKNGGCPDNLAELITKEKDLMKICYNSNIPCIDSDKVSKSSQDIIDLDNQHEKIRLAYENNRMKLVSEFSEYNKNMSLSANFKPNTKQRKQYEDLAKKSMEKMVPIYNEMKQQETASIQLKKKMDDLLAKVSSK